MKPIRVINSCARTTGVVVLSICICTLVTPSRARAATVVSLGDSGPGTLRQAVLDAAAGETIDFAVTGTIVLSSGQITIDKNLTIDGPGAGLLTISGNDKHRVFNSFGAVVSFSGVRITGGSVEGGGGGGPAVSGGTATLSNVVVDANTAELGGGGVVVSGGNLNLSDVVVAANTSTGGGGGGIAVSGGGSAIITDSAIRDNVSASGGSGGIAFFGGNHVITNSAIIGNDGGSGGTGGIGAIGGAVLDVNNCTFSGNFDLMTGGGAMTLNGAAATVNNSTFTDNGAGIQVFVQQAGAVLDVRNTIIDRSSGTSACLTVAGGAIVSNAYNLSSDASCGFSGTDIINTDPMLAALADNGGPTLTHAPLVGSPVEEAGNPAPPGSGGSSCEAVDQRGGLRPGFSICDIGAFERGCGDGVVGAPLESCDDGGVADGDGCDSSCRVEECWSCIGSPSTCTALPALTPCDDSNACTLDDECDGAGGCSGSEEPATGCFDALIAQLTIGDNADDTKDKLKWKWLKGDEVQQGDLGDPSSDTAYTLCIYDDLGGSTTIAASLTVAPGDDWQDKDPKGWKYKDKDGVSSGVTNVQLKTSKSGVANTAKALVAAKGANISLPLPSAPDRYFVQFPAVAAQLHNDAGQCWTSTFLDADTRKTTDKKFVAKSR